MNALVVPSNRPDSMRDFIEAWNPYVDWDLLIVMEDATEPTDVMAQALKGSRAEYIHLSHADVKRALGDNSWIIGKKDSACRAFGMYCAWSRDAEYILTLDDDVRPCIPHLPLLEKHVEAMTMRSRFQPSVHDLWTRGMPDKPLMRTDVKASMGLWQGVPDLYSEDLRGGFRTYKPPIGTRLVPHGEMTTVCGMNFCVHRDAMPLAWFPLQGEGYEYARFDDIWMGLILQTGFRALGWQLSIGTPHVRHERASDPDACARREAPGRKVNDAIWRAFDGMSFRASTPTEAASIIGCRLRGSDIPYLEKFGRGLELWSGLFGE